MRLTIINQFYKPDLAPTAHLAASLAEHRANRGDDVSVITSQGGYVQASPLESTLTSSNLRIIRLWTPRLGKHRAITRIIDYAAFYIQAVIRILLLSPQDVIVSLTTPPFIAWVGVLHKWIHPHSKLILWNMDSYPEMLERTNVLPEGSLVARILRNVNKALYKHLDRLICLDEAMFELLSDNYIRNQAAEFSTVIPNWEPWDQYSGDSPPTEWSDGQELELDDQFVLLYLGNAGFGHRFETVLAAAERLRNKPVTFLFVGGGEKWQHLAEQREKRGLKNLRLRPYVPKETTPAVMELVDCALITLNKAALGVISPSKLHSNLAMSLPIIYIGPEGSNVDQAIKNFDCGVSLRHGDVDELIRFVENLRGDDELLSRYRHNARRAFEEAYNDRVALPKFDALLDSFDPSRR